MHLCECVRLSVVSSVGLVAVLCGCGHGWHFAPCLFTTPRKCHHGDMQLVRKLLIAYLISFVTLL